jgi:uncharacterized membrane protein YGL010W
MLIEFFSSKSVLNPCLLLSHIFVIPLILTAAVFLLHYIMFGRRSSITKTAHLVAIKDEFE